MRPVLWFFVYPVADHEGTLVPFLIGVLVALLTPDPYWRWLTLACAVMAVVYVLARRRRFRFPHLYAASSLSLLAALCFLVFWLKR